MLAIIRVSTGAKQEIFSGGCTTNIKIKILNNFKKYYLKLK